MGIASKWGSHIFYGGLLSLCLSLIFSEYISQYLYAHYQSWTEWRSITGRNPNILTSLLQKSSWAAFFFSSWFMLWKLDTFFHQPLSAAGANEKDEQNINSSEKVEHAKRQRDREEKRRKKEDQEQGQRTIEDEKENCIDEETEQAPGKVQFNDKDLIYGKVLGLEEPFTTEGIKPKYRKIIAQYHPDRVAVMGEEIQEVAEKKAKEINEAYDYFRKKFDLN